MHSPVKGRLPGRIAKTWSSGPVRGLGFVVMEQEHLHKAQQRHWNRNTWTKHNNVSGTRTPGPSTTTSVEHEHLDKEQKRHWNTNTWTKHNNISGTRTPGQSTTTSVEHEHLDKAQQHQWNTNTWTKHNNISGTRTPGQSTTTSVEHEHLDKAQQHQWNTNTWTKHNNTSGTRTPGQSKTTPVEHVSINQSIVFIATYQVNIHKHGMRHGVESIRNHTHIHRNIDRLHSINTCTNHSNSNCHLGFKNLQTRSKHRRFYIIQRNHQVFKKL